MLVSQLCDRYLREYAGGKKTAGADRRMIDRYIRPEMGHMAVTEIRYTHAQQLHHSLRKTPYQANRVLSVLSMLFTMAERWEIDLPRGNPCTHVQRFKEKKRRRYLSKIEAMAVFRAIQQRFDKHPLECALLLLELYTGARPSELKTALWSMIDGDRIEHDDTKTGQRTIYLPPQALAVLAQLPRSRQWIIGPDVSARYVWASVLDDTKIENLRMYDLRHSFASFGLAGGLSLPKLQELMGHSSPYTTMRYAHLSRDGGTESVGVVGEQLKGIGL